MPNKEIEELLATTDKYFNDVLNAKRIIMMYGEINSPMAKDINSKLLAMAILSRKDPILFEINSPGGSCPDGLAIIDMMTRIGSPIFTIVTGEACSMASLISIVGNMRFMTDNAYYMMHPIREWICDYLEFIKDRVAYVNKLEERCLNIYRKYTKLPKELIAKSQRGEVWLSAKECLKYKIIDRIV